MMLRQCEVELATAGQEESMSLSVAYGIRKDSAAGTVRYAAAFLLAVADHGMLVVQVGGDRVAVEVIRSGHS
jgi:hypothetical protein